MKTFVLFFEPETFRHVRTEYTRVIYATEQRRIAGGGGALPAATNQQASSARFEAYEEFSDFKEEAGLNLPHTYKFHLSIQSEIKPALVDWNFTLTDFAFNIATLIAAGELTSGLGASPRRPSATGTRAISNLPGTILPAA